jgi:hypothetical protein
MPSNTVKETWKDLWQPKMDTCISYLTCSDAAAADLSLLLQRKRQLTVSFR